jgi:hypothetical protein
MIALTIITLLGIGLWVLGRRERRLVLNEIAAQRQTWTQDFAEDIPGGVTYSVTVDPAFAKALGAARTAEIVQDTMTVSMQQTEPTAPAAWRGDKTSS